MRRLAQARNPYSRYWLWIPGSSLRDPRNDDEPAVQRTFISTQRNSASSTEHARRRNHATPGVSETWSWSCCGCSNACRQRECGAAAADPGSTGPCAPAWRWRGARARYRKRGRSSPARTGSLGAPLASALASASLGLAALAPSSLASLAPPSLVRWLVLRRVTLLPC